MKRTALYISRALLLMAGLCISCQKEQNFSEENGAPVNEVIVKATIGSADTKVSFTEDATNNKLKAAWEETDHILGWDKDGNAIELKIASIDNGTAIFKPVEGSSDIPTSGKVYMIYAPGKNKSNISSSSLEYDLSNQNGDKLPALMTATGEVEDNVLSLSFTNQLAIVAVKNPKFPVTEETAITGLQLSGSNILTKVTFSVENEALKMEPSEEGDIARGCSFTTEADGTTTETMVYFAVLPNSTAADVTVSTTAPEGYQISFEDKKFEAGKCYLLDQKTIGKQTFAITAPGIIEGGTITTDPSGSAAWGEIVTVTATPATGYELKSIKWKEEGGTDEDITSTKTFTMPAKAVTVTVTFKESLTGAINGHNYVKIGSKKWATTNLGATNPQDYGEYFQWGETAGHKCNGTTSGSAFESSYNFGWSTTPFNGGQSSYDKTAFDSCKSTCLTGDNLKSDYDAAFKATGWGDPWHMPTKEDFADLADNGVWIWTTNYNGTGKSGYIVYVAQHDDDKGKAKMNGTWKEWNSSTNSYDSGSAATGSYSESSVDHIFFPAAGFGNGTTLNYPVTYGYYWSSSLNTVDPANADYLLFGSGSVSPQYNSNRFYGFSVRPVSD